MSADSPETVSVSFFKKVFSPFKIRSKETVVNTESSIKSVINRTEAAVDKNTLERGFSIKPRIAGERSLMCGLYSDIVTFLARRDGLESHIYQVKKLHDSLIHSQLSHKADQHVFSTVTGLDGKTLLVDLSIGQFLEGERSNQASNPLIQQLLQNGYVELTDQTLQQYLLFTNPKMDDDSIDRLKQVRASDLNPRRVPELGYDREEEDLTKLTK